jgi:hypothetical protein
MLKFFILTFFFRVCYPKNLMIIVASVDQSPHLPASASTHLPMPAEIGEGDHETAHDWTSGHRCTSSTSTKSFGLMKNSHPVCKQLYMQSKKRPRPLHPQHRAAGHETLFLTLNRNVSTCCRTYGQKKGLTFQYAR